MIEYKNVSLADRVYEVLEHNILCGVYAPGEVISEARLSEELGVSRTPIREAMSRLSHEKLIKEKHGGTVVIGVTEKDVKDLFEVKRRLEVLATKKATKYITDKKLDALKENVEQQEFFAQKGDVEKVRDLDTAFHDIIFSGCGSVTFEIVLSPIHHKMMKYRKISLENAERIMDSVEEHRALYEAIKNRDAEAAEALSLQHINHSYENLKKGGIE